MTLGFFPALKPAGGTYQYSASVADALTGAAASGDAVAVVPPGADVPTVIRSWQRVEIEALEPPPRLAFIGAPRVRRGLRSVRRLVRKRAPLDLDAVASRPDIARALAAHDIDLNLFPGAMGISFEIGLPFVIAIHDLQHRLQPEFPEVSSGGRWQQREHLFRNAARYASAILADSDIGREDILDAYGSFGVDAERVHVLPFVAPPEVRGDHDEAAVASVRETYALPERYLFYPAQFWPHKNHVRLIEALGALRRRGVRVPLVLCGAWSDPFKQATFAEMNARARALGVDEQLTVLGYVPADEIAALYRAAVALVFPTFFGPTNIPVLEAWTLDCPVITSDIRGIREQVGDAALLVDPRDVDDIAAAIEQIWTDERLRRELASRGRTRAAAFSPDDFRRRLADIIDRARAMGPPDAGRRVREATA
jgi:glycosyltransferase involved in cell wall biosynthesis